MTSPTIPYTHWMYFTDQPAAERCAAELAGMDFLCGVELSLPLTDAERAAFAAEFPQLAGMPEPSHGHWLLRAARGVEVDDMIERHRMVEEIVVRHGGFYDGGESGWLPGT